MGWVSDPEGDKVRKFRGFSGRTAFLIALPLLFLLAGCGTAAQAPAGDQSAATGQPQYGGILKLHWLGSPPTDFDLLKSCASVCSSRVGPAYSQLVRIDPLKSAEDAIIMPDLAERWEYSADGKILTLYLRKNAKWRDGKPVTAADVKYTLDRSRDPNDPVTGTSLTTISYLKPVEAVEAVDDYTVRLQLKRPMASLLNWLGSGQKYIVAKHAWPTLDPRNEMMGSGPYRLKKYEAGVSIEFEKNPDYFLTDKPYVDGIIDYFLKDNATRVAAFETEQIDMLRFIDETMWDGIHKADPKAQLVPWNALRGSLLAVNMARKPYDDPRVRKAIFMALDRQEGKQLIGGAWGTIGGYITAGPWALPEAELRKMPGYGDPKAQAAEAKKLLTEAGYPQGFKADLVTAQNNPIYEASSVWAKDQLKKNLNIDVNVEILPPADYSNRYSTTKTFDLHLLTSPASYPDPSGHASFWGPGNPYSFNDKEIFDLLDRQDQTLDTTERKKLVNDMERQLLERGPFAVITWIKLGTALHPWVKNHFEPVGWYSGNQYDHVWLAK